MTSTHKSYYSFSAVLAVVAMFLGLAVSGCGSEGSNSSSADVNYNRDTAKIVIRAGVDEGIDAKAMSGTDIFSYVVSLLDKDGKLLQRESFAQFAVGTTKEYEVVQATDTTPMYRVMRFGTDYVEEAKQMRIDYYLADNTLVGFGCVKDLNLSNVSTNEFSNFGLDTDDFEYTEATSENCSLVIATEDPTSIMVDDTVTFTAEFKVDGTVEQVTDQAKFVSSSSSVVSIENNVGTGKKKGTSNITASYQGFDSNSIAITVDAEPGEPKLMFKDNNYDTITSLEVPEDGATIQLAYADEDGAVTNIAGNDDNLTITWDSANDAYATFDAETMRFTWVSQNDEAMDLVAKYLDENGNDVEATLSVTTLTKCALLICDLDGNDLTTQSNEITQAGLDFKVIFVDSDGSQTNLDPDDKKLTMTWDDDYSSYVAQNKFSLGWRGAHKDPMVLTFAYEDCADEYPVTFTTSPKLSNLYLLDAAKYEFNAEEGAVYDKDTATKVDDPEGVTIGNIDDPALDTEVEVLIIGKTIDEDEQAALIDANAEYGIILKCDNTMDLVTLSDTSFKVTAVPTETGIHQVSIFARDMNVTSKEILVTWTI